MTAVHNFQLTMQQQIQHTRMSLTFMQDWIFDTLMLAYRGLYNEQAFQYC